MDADERRVERAKLGRALMTLHTPVTAYDLRGALKVLEGMNSKAEIWIAAGEDGEIVLYGTPRAPFMYHQMEAKG